MCHFYCVLLLSWHDITRCVLKVLENVLWVTQEASGWIRFALTTISLHPLICGNEAFGQGQSVVMQWSHGLISPLHDIVSFQPHAPLEINSGEGRTSLFLLRAPRTPVTPLNSLFGHVTRLGDDTAARHTLRRQVNISLGRLPDPSWKRPPGRPRRKWLDQIRSDNNLRLPADLWR